MDGFTLKRLVRQILDEAATGLFMEDSVTYDYIYFAVLECVRRTGCVTATQTVTTVDGTATYRLNRDFLHLYMKDRDDRIFLRINDGTNNHEFTFRDYSILYYENQTTEKAIPEAFSIIPATIRSTIASTATSIGAATYDESILTDSTAPFSSTTVEVGDRVINITDGSWGYVVTVTDTSHVIVALQGGTANDWTSSDVYKIIPQEQYNLFLSPTPSTSAYTITVPYVRKPDPVYSAYRAYPLPRIFELPIAEYAVFLYKYKDREPNYGDALYKHFDLVCRQNNYINQMAAQKKGFKAYFKKRNGFPDRSYR